MDFFHSVVELCTAVKGQALVHFLNEGSKKVVYLDPDIVVYDNLSEIEKLLDDHSIILTPHQAVPEEGHDNIVSNEVASLNHGIYNFGFYAVSNTQEGREFSRWWRDRLLDYCYDDIPNGIFTDQRWGNLVPAFFPSCYILRNPEYNGNSSF